MSRHVAVIGAGWAGCAAAVELVAQGRQVTLFEAARTAGGRAREVTFNDYSLDNGQHILLGAYAETLRLMALVGVNIQTAVLRVPLQMRYPANTGMDFVAAKLPAPWHLLVGMLRASGLAAADKFALVSFSASARRIDWTLEHDCSVTDLLRAFHQTERLIQLMWRPLCLAALNTPPEEASAQVFLQVLKDSLGAQRASSDMLLPRVDLSALFPMPAIDYIVARGGSVNFGKRISALRRDSYGWSLQSGANASAESTHIVDQVIIATDLHNARALLKPLTGNIVMPEATHQAITTCYLQYEASCRLDAVFYALADNPLLGHWGQFVFDRGQLTVAQQGLFAVVISAAQQAILLDHTDLIAAVTAQLALVFSRPDFAHPLWSKVISEKRATFSCVPGMPRAGNDIGLGDVVLAGDYTASSYPATLEAAVRSGVTAARSLIGS